MYFHLRNKAVYFHQGKRAVKFYLGHVAVYFHLGRASDGGEQAVQQLHHFLGKETRVETSAVI